MVNSERSKSLIYKQHWAGRPNKHEITYKDMKLFIDSNQLSST